MNYEVVGYRFFESKKSGAKMVTIFCTFEPSSRSTITGKGTETVFTLAENVEGDLYVGCKVELRYNKGGFVTEVIVD